MFLTLTIIINSDIFNQIKPISNSVSLFQINNDWGVIGKSINFSQFKKKLSLILFLIKVREN
jgi:hypothetical protein